MHPPELDLLKRHCKLTIRKEALFSRRIDVPVNNELVFEIIEDLNNPIFVPFDFATNEMTFPE